MGMIRDFASLAIRLLAAKLLGWWLVIPALILALVGFTFVSVLVIGGSSSTSSNQDPCREAGALTAGSSQAFGGNAADTKSQVDVVKAIDEGVRELGYSGQVTRLVSIAAMGESTLENIDYGDNAINPDGSVADSIGILQQQGSWGTAKERMDPKTAAQLFILGPKKQGGGLADVQGWQDMSETLAIHEVQANADPNHYAKNGWIAHTDKVLNEAGIEIDREGKENDASAQASNNGSSVDTASADECKGATTAGKPGGSNGGNDTYPWDDSVIPGPGVYTEDGAGFFYGECTSYAAWKLAEHYGAEGSNTSSWKIGNTKGGNGSKLGNAATWREAWEARGWEVTTKPTANSVAWWGANSGEGIGPAGHVGWIDKVEEDGKTFQLSEYNNTYLAPPGHKYSHRPEVTMTDPGAPDAFLIPPDEAKL